MLDNMDKVVKCISDKCGQYFMHTEKNTKCPFCHTEYAETAGEKTKEKPMEKKVVAKTQKDSFKIWKDN